MKTASFFTYAGPGRVSIARYAPWHAGRLPRVLGAGARRDMLKMRGEEYLKHYGLVLAALDPQQTWDRLHALAGDAEPVLLCWERPPLRQPDNWCHHRYAAEWFGQELGHEVPEMDA